ncbi:nuclear pore-associated protein 1-like [Physeter macrocephalus]|uniref:Nuclear pore-associated protein 1-like n=1 Tax=Physeter macrocephalus TaxID=9755 RepID=A0A9W2WKI3_PHYMC|nr:nuclear pore-associated protein 1-like [Physeter catodon]
MSGKEQQREESSGIPSRSSSSLLPTSSRPCKRKIPLPLFLLLPWLRSPPSGKEALTWDRASDPIWGIPLKKNEGPFHSVRATTPLISDLPTPPSIPPFSFQPPSHEKEAPTPICVDSPPLLYIPTPLPVPTINPPILTGQPMTSMAIPSTSTVMASGSLTLKPTVHAEVYMDTTAPSQAVIFRSPPGFRVEQRHPAGVPGPPCMASAIIGASAGRNADSEAMNTTPSQSVIFQSVPFSRQHQQPFHRAVPSSGNTPPSGSNASVHACLDAFTCKAELGANDGQRPNEYFLLGNPAASAQDKILVAPAA